MGAIKPITVIPFRRIPSTDRDLNLLQAHLQDALRSVGSNQAFLQGVQLNTGTNLVSHGLGRNYVSYYLLNNDTSVATRSRGVPNPDPSKFLAIQAAGPVVVDIVVF